ncbi:putative sporulation protein YtaF [Paenibacillus cellulosilyticus]|uniref:Putative sporulation protein YtaF n=1 Tax=Paenibacillus cellulosilyticus TaxID=375489 RepID=A0A2V2YV67_9BACL|nr:manganese efflux pump [Paenibacillus cellulosilyticus]PWW05117.1 putative sporulation protein YtaF [Paenibacillus cellulosilyticus]QKS48666.1 manganese efflux pump [Paenibacillus cellulosilyticus]
MHWVSVVIIGIAANIDNLGVGITFGARSTRVPWLSNLVIALISASAAFVAMTAGSLLAHLFPVLWGNVIGGLILIAMGLWGIRSQLIKGKMGRAPDVQEREAASDPNTGQSNREKRMVSRAESVSIGLALSVNAMASSFGAGISGVSPLLCSLSVGLFSYLTVELGVRIGIRFARSPLGRYAEFIGCALLILIGIYEIMF